MLLNVTVGGMTPPFGYTMFAFKGAAPNVPMGADIQRILAVRVAVRGLDRDRRGVPGTRHLAAGHPVRLAGAARILEGEGR